MADQILLDFPHCDNRDDGGRIRYLNSLPHYHLNNDNCIVSRNDLLWKRGSPDRHRSSGPENRPGDLDKKSPGAFNLRTGASVLP